MKKVIVIAAVVLVAIVGLTSFNGKEQHKEKGNASLIAQLEGTEGNQNGTVAGQATGGGKKSQ